MQRIENTEAAADSTRSTPQAKRRRAPGAHITGSLAWITLAGLPLLLAMGACARGPYLPPGRVPRTQITNVQPVQGAEIQIVRGPYRGQPTLRDWSRDGLVDRFHGRQCGTRVQVTGASGTSVHGRLIVYRHVDGRGPAGRGDYLVEVSEERIREAAEGRLSMQYEPYRDNNGQMYTGWVIVMSDRPLSCRAPGQPAPTCLDASSDPDGDGWGWENEESCEVAPNR